MELTLLARSYSRRKRFEATLLAQEVVIALTAAWTGEGAAPPTASATTTPKPAAAPTAPKALLGQMGITL